MASVDLLKEAEANAAGNPEHAIQIYKRILENTAGKFQSQAESL
jgi:hypothetical protein